MIANNEESMQIIILTEFSVHLPVTWFHFCRNIWQSKIGEILETRIEPGNKEHKYAVEVIDKENRTIAHLPKYTKWKIVKRYLFCTFWWVEQFFSRCYWKSVNMGDGQGMQVPRKLNFKENIKIIKMLKNIICKWRFWKSMIDVYKRYITKNALTSEKLQSTEGFFRPREKEIALNKLNKWGKLTCVTQRKRTQFQKQQKN